eukprot:TRINITY_DN2352_c0_g1_i3.p1 TRINITY_DN2352_c0_g1~~TRINITY_DN2352_c0_g1_i3.p1  ORF type:complete len:163 (+),score=26.12 TRINITY_DN2352_c0_g1_i3:116-604(+)
MIRRPPRSTQSRSSAASDVYKRQVPYRARVTGMFKSNRSLVISTLLTGTAVATGTLIYGMYQEDEELSILDDTLPPVIGNGLLPPPATYVMTTPPPVEIPGIRRLRIVRPALANPAVPGSESAPQANAAAEQASDFYLTGTRSADLIRSPVEARIETFPTLR